MSYAPRLAPLPPGQSGVIQELDAAGTILKSYVCGNYIDDVLQMRSNTNSGAGMHSRLWASQSRPDESGF